MLSKTIVTCILTAFDVVDQHTIFEFDIIICDVVNQNLLNIQPQAANGELFRAEYLVNFRYILINCTKWNRIMIINQLPQTLTYYNVANCKELY